MSDNVGLSTPRGSGTSGYVQRNLAHPHHHQSSRLNPYSRPPPPSSSLHTQRKPDQGLLDHDRKRQIEVKVFALRDELEEAGELTEEQIDEKCDALREKLKKEADKGGVGPRRNIKSFQVHELADAKMKESERLRQALRISKDYEEGGHWRRQEERKRGAMGEGVEAEVKRQDEGGRDGRGPPRERAQGRDRDQYRDMDLGQGERPRERDDSREREDSRERYRGRSPSRDRYDSRERSPSRDRDDSRDRYRERSASQDRYQDRRGRDDRDDYDDEDRGDRYRERDDRR
ncbi:putative pre-mRNA-splicing factor CWC21 [Triangularia verruculosa]|uniref:Pre-mRNA-splicing factor CWC21 n=1 Tax=Triangularia verruculosa TaxID=2587418 RepID=A0AAN6XRG4_9PEZI|nr:putative pre-mRNA-splicing factor CWC21 [Triangularia verruculosa]